MTDALSKADQLMRKASESFARGKLQKAYRAYGEAVTAYLADPTSARERLALAYYTRVMLLLAGDATGKVESDLDAGDKLCSSESSFVDKQRFAGLFRYARACWKRQNEFLVEAQDLIDEARGLLSSHGRPHDHFELEREQVRLASERREWDRAVKAAQRATEVAQSPKQVVMGRLLTAEIHGARDNWKEMLDVLERAASFAFDHELKDELWDLQDRIAILKRNHPEVAT